MDSKELFNLFKTAIEKEQFAQKFYEEMIRETPSEEIKEVLKSFLGQERFHEEKLKEMYADLKTELEGK